MARTLAAAVRTLPAAVRTLALCKMTAWVRSAKTVHTVPPIAPRAVPVTRLHPP